MQTVVLVEGTSDKTAVEAVASRLGRDLGTEGVVVIAIGGAKNIRRYLEQFARRGSGTRVVGLCDERESADFHRANRAVERTGVMDAFSFHVCVRDLEDELIRAVGPRAVEEVIEGLGDIESFRRFQKQPFHRDRPWTRNCTGSSGRPVGARSATRPPSSAPSTRTGCPTPCSPSSGLADS